MTSPTTTKNVLLRIESAYQEELITDSGLKFWLDPSYHKNQHCTVTATVAALPSNPNPKEKKILDQLSIGDEVCVSYMVVASFTFQGDGHRFMLTTEENDKYREYVNAKGYWVKVYALQGKIWPIWVGVYQDNYMNVIDGVQGDQAKVETWLSQFPLGKTDLYSFDNFFEYKKTDYWKCDLTDIYAKRVKGHLVAVGDRVICQPVDEIVPEPYLIKQHKGHTVSMRYQDRARVLTGGKEKGLKKGEVIGFDQNYLEKYEFFGKKYYIINQNLVLGKWN